MFSAFDRKSPLTLLMLISVGMSFAFGIWQGLLNNFVIDRAAFTGREIGILQSVREIPGFLAFTAIFILLLIKEQRFGLLSLAIMGVGTLSTAFFPSEYGLYMTTMIMSIGFHYFETVKQSLSLQWFDKKDTAANLGRLISVSSFASLLAYGSIWLGMTVFDWSMEALYIIGGIVGCGIALYAWFAFPVFKEKTPQRKSLVLRSRYGLYYALVFLSGARRQIFVVFAGFLMVEKFDFNAAEISALFIMNGIVNMICAPLIGKLIGKIGERKSLSLEYLGLILVFVAYAFVENPWVAAGLYLIDHVLFAMAIAVKTYFQKIADPADIAPTAGIAFTINHIAAVVLPVLYGVLWLHSPEWVFFTGALLAGVSFILSQLVPDEPREGNEFLPVFQMFRLKSYSNR